MKTKMIAWFEEVWLMVVMWWQIGLSICVLDGFLAYVKMGTLAIFITTTCQALLAMFFIVPLVLGSILYFTKGRSK